MKLPHASEFCPVLLLTSNPRGWQKHPKDVSQEAVDTVLADVRALGITIEHIQVAPDTIRPQLALFPPDQYVIINWCEGWGNDLHDYETPIAIFEELGYAFTGVSFSVMKIDLRKDLARAVLQAAQVAIAPSRIVDRVPVVDWDIFPAIVKPSTVHSSEGISRNSVVDTPAQLNAQVTTILAQYEGPVIVEQFLTGMEYKVGVWGNGDDVHVLPVSAIDYSHIADYHDQLLTDTAKWQSDTALYQSLWYSDTTGWHYPGTMSSKIAQQIHDNATHAYRSYGLRDYARFDMREHNGVVYVIDINSNPRISFDCEFPSMCAQIGYSYGQCIAQIVAFAMARMPGR